MDVGFRAPEYHADGHFELADYRFLGSTERGWEIRRNGRSHLSLGPGYRLLRTQECGVCSTDLARHFLPFPLPQVIGHELIALDEGGRRHVVEINASHQARGIESDCPFCRAGLAKHCPERVVLGIDRLPGGFGPWVLAPQHAVIRVPDEIPSETAVLIEPFAAALNAVHTVDPQPGETVAVLGPRRLGMLVVAALAAFKNRTGRDYEILALSRQAALCELATRLGATRARRIEGDGREIADGIADVVVDTTGNPDALELAIRLARREVHVKSTHGRPAGGLAHLTELVVDELRLGPYPDPHGRSDDLPAGACIAWLSPRTPPAIEGASRLYRGTPQRVLDQIERATPAGALPRADLAIVDGLAGIDAAIRPFAGREVALVRPRGSILLDVASPPPAQGCMLEDALRNRGLRLSSSRCGDFREALSLLQSDAELRSLGGKLITHLFESDRISEAFVVARSHACIKAVIRHGVES